MKIRFLTALIASFSLALPAAPAPRKADLLFSPNLAGHYFTLADGDSVAVNVSKMDQLNLEATFSGTVTQAGLMSTRGREPYRIQISGVIGLHRSAAPAETSAGTYLDCDPV